MSADKKPTFIARLDPATDEVVERLRELLPADTRDAPRFVTGWREWLALPELGIPGIKAKIDTGARTSALHTHDYEIFRRGEDDWVRFHLHPLRRSEDVVLQCEAKILEHREVKDSGGHPELRPFIATTARLGECEWPIGLSLTNRESMKFRMLLGRQALAGWFLVDPSASYLMGGSLSRAYRH